MKLPVNYTYGFTLIELMVVIAIIAVVAGATVPSFNNYIRGQNMRQAQDRLVNDLRSTQIRALTGVNHSDVASSAALKFWGVRFTRSSSNYEVFLPVDSPNHALPTSLTTVCNASNTHYRRVVSTGTLPGNVFIGGATTNHCVFFSFANGNVSLIPIAATFPRDIIVGYSTASTDETCKKVVINSMGSILSPSSSVNCSTGALAQ